MSVLVCENVLNTLEYVLVLEELIASRHAPGKVTRSPLQKSRGGWLIERTVSALLAVSSGVTARLPRG